MKRQFRFSSTVLRYGSCLLLCFLSWSNMVASAQENTIFIQKNAGPGQAGLSCSINGTDVGTLLLKTCDLNKDGTVSPAELKEVVSACFKLWDTNTDGSMSQDELVAGLKELFPQPVGRGFRTARGIRNVNGVAVEIPADKLLTPNVQVATRVMAGADSNKDGALSLQELNDYLDKNFGQWDHDGNGSLNAEELGQAFVRLTMPDLPNP